MRVFYDKFEEAILWGKDLYVHLQRVYRDNSNFTVVFCSRSYAEKRWATHELKSAQERALRENAEYILDIPTILWSMFCMAPGFGWAEREAMVQVWDIEEPRLRYLRIVCKEMGAPKFGSTSELMEWVRQHWDLVKAYVFNKFYVRLSSGEDTLYLLNVLREIYVRPSYNLFDELKRLAVKALQKPLLKNPRSLHPNDVNTFCIAGV